VPDLATMLADPAIEGVILTVPNEQHLPLALEVAKAGKHVYTEKPIASTLEEGLAIADLEAQYGVTVTVGHSARLMAGIRQIRAAIDAGELGRVAFIEANFSNERALELTPSTWRWYRDRAPGGPLSQLAIHQFDALHYLGGEIAEVSSMASKLSPVGAEVDDQSMTMMRFADGKVGYVGSCWTSPGIYAIRVFGAKGLMHYEIDFSTWDLNANPTLPIGFLNAYKNVYWFTGNSYPAPITPYESALKSFLDGGGNLFMSGQDILDQSAGTTAFVHDYLHIDWDGTDRQNDQATDAVHGVTGNAVTDGIGAVPLDHSVLNAAFEDQLTLIGDATPAFTDDTAAPDALTFAGGYKVMFLAFPLEAYGSATDKADLIDRAQTWFGS